MRLGVARSRPSEPLLFAWNEATLWRKHRHMDDADRIPIDVGYEVGSAADPSGARTTENEDGTLFINILVQAPCDPAVNADEIVVCASSPTPQEIPGADGTFAEGGFKPEVELAPNVKAKARAETDPMTGADRAMIDLNYRF